MTAPPANNKKRVEWSVADLLARLLAGAKRGALGHDFCQAEVTEEQKKAARGKGVGVPSSRVGIIGRFFNEKAKGYCTVGRRMSLWESVR